MSISIRVLYSENCCTQEKCVKPKNHVYTVM